MIGPAEVGEESIVMATQTLQAGAYSLAGGNNSMEGDHTQSAVIVAIGRGAVRTSRRLYGLDINIATQA